MASASPPGCSMASRTALNAANLEGLGARRLAGLLIEIGAGNPAARRRLRLELAAAESGAAVARVVRNRLATIGRSRAFLDWRKRRDLAADLELHRKAIVERVTDTAEVLELMWQLTELANPTLARCEDTGETVMGVFCAAVADLGTSRSTPQSIRASWPTGPSRPRSGITTASTTILSASCLRPWGMKGWSI